MICKFSMYSYDDNKMEPNVGLAQYVGVRTYLLLLYAYMLSYIGLLNGILFYVRV